jgi:lipoprotein
MKRLLILMLTIAAATSCLKEGRNEFSWSKDIIGTLTTKDVRTGQTVYSTETAQAVIEVPDGFTNAVNFHLDNVKFVENMPAVSIVIPDLRFTVYSDTEEELYPIGSWVISQSNVIPTVGGVPYENYKMNSVNGVITDDTVKLTFTLMFDEIPYEVTFVKDTPIDDDTDLPEKPAE